MRTRVCAFLFALAVSAAPALGAVATTKYSLTNSGWTDLGAGPLLLAFRGTGVFAVGDTTPSLGGEGFGVRTGRSFPLKTTSHVWARAPGAFGVDAYAAPINAGGGSTGCAQATNYLARTTGGNAGGNATNITTLICGLVSDGVITGDLSGARGCGAHLDTLYVLAQQNQADAQLNLCGTSYSITTVGIIRTVTFTSYKGFSFSGASYLSTNFDATAATSPHFVQDNASFGLWAYAVVPENSWQMGDGYVNFIYDYYLDYTVFVARVNHTSAAGPPPPGTKGLFVGDRSTSTDIVPYWDGVAFTTQTGVPSVAPVPTAFLIGAGSAQTISEAHIGGSLGATLNLALYNRLRTYMTAVGVP